MRDGWLITFVIGDVRNLDELAFGWSVFPLSMYDLCMFIPQLSFGIGFNAVRGLPLVFEAVWVHLLIFCSRNGRPFITGVGDGQKTSKNDLKWYWNKNMCPFCIFSINKCNANNNLSILLTTNFILGRYSVIGRVQNRTNDICKYA